MKKIILVIGLLTSIITLAEKNNVELRASTDLNNRVQIKENQKIDNILKKNIELSTEYTRKVLPLSSQNNLEVGIGISYKENKFKIENTEKLDYTIKPLRTVPIYGVVKYTFGNYTKLTPYIKAKLGFSSNSGNITTGTAKLDFGTGIYTGIGVGLKYKNFTTDLSYNVNSIKTKFIDKTSNNVIDKFRLKNSSIGLGFGYNFEF